MMSNDRTHNLPSEPSLLLGIYERLAALGRARRKSACLMNPQSKPLTLSLINKAAKQYEVNGPNEE